MFGSYSGNDGSGARGQQPLTPDEINRAKERVIKGKAKRTPLDAFVVGGGNSMANDYETLKRRRRQDSVLQGKVDSKRRTESEERRRKQEDVYRGGIYGRITELSGAKQGIPNEEVRRGSYGVLQGGGSQPWDQRRDGQNQTYRSQ